MTHEDFVLFLITFVATALAGAAILIGPWRRQDRALARLASLAALADSPHLNDSSREKFKGRLTNETTQLFADDAFRRALKVQQAFYTALAGGAIALVWIGFQHHGLAKAGPLCGALACFVLGLGITNVPPQHWRMPAIFDSQGGPAVPAWMRSPASERAAAVLALKAGDTVLVYGCRRGEDLTAIREAVGDTGAVIGVVRRSEDLRYAEIVVLRSGWSNVETIFGDITNVKDGVFNAVAALNGFERRDDIDATVRGFLRVLRPGGGLMIVSKRRRSAKHSITADAVGQLVRGRFADVGLTEQASGDVEICAKKPAAA